MREAELQRSALLMMVYMAEALPHIDDEWIRRPDNAEIAQAFAAAEYGAQTLAAAHN